MSAPGTAYQDLLRLVNESTRRAARDWSVNVWKFSAKGEQNKSARLMGRTRTNKIAVFEGDNELIGNGGYPNRARQRLQFVWHAD